MTFRFSVLNGKGRHKVRENNNKKGEIKIIIIFNNNKTKF